VTPARQQIIEAPRQEPKALTPMDMVAQAVSQGANIEVLEKLMGLQERWEANQARKAFEAAMADAKAKMPAIVKNKLVDFVGKTGIRTHYKHETLDEVVHTVEPHLAQYGLHPRFRTDSSQPGFVTVACRISHRDGYSEENSLTAPVDTSGNKNAIQAIGSDVTYLQRYTLKAALGLAASEDDDGRGAGSGDTITDEQAHRLLDLINETEADAARFCKFFKVGSVPDLPAGRFDEAVRLLNLKRRPA
jgi:hypothetical protein